MKLGLFVHKLDISYELYREYFLGPDWIYTIHNPKELLISEDQDYHTVVDLDNINHVLPNISSCCIVRIVKKK